MRSLNWYFENEQTDAEFSYMLGLVIDDETHLYITLNTKNATTSVVDIKFVHEIYEYFNKEILYTLNSITVDINDITIKL